jgi:hypothetical protein
MTFRPIANTRCGSATTGEAMARAVKPSEAATASYRLSPISV